MTAVKQWREVCRRVEDAGHPVLFVPHWEDLGHGVLDVQGGVNHHTAGPRSGATTSLRVVTFGRTGLPGPVANTYSSRPWNREPAKFYMVAARMAYHAGLGGWRGLYGNSSVAGHEAENDGVGEPWTDEHLDLIRVKDVAQCDVFGFPPELIPEHYEWAPTRKIDRKGVNGHAHRRHVARLLRGEEEEMTPAEWKRLDARLDRMERRIIEEADDRLVTVVKALPPEVADVVMKRLQPKGGAALGTEVDGVRLGVRRALIELGVSADEIRKLGV